MSTAAFAVEELRTFIRDMSVAVVVMRTPCPPRSNIRTQQATISSEVMRGAKSQVFFVSRSTCLLRVAQSGCHFVFLEAVLELIQPTGVVKGEM